MSEQIQPTGWGSVKFGKGNTAAQRHGAHNMAVIEPRAREIVIDLTERYPHLDTADTAIVFSYAKLIAQDERLTAYLDEHGEIFDLGRDKGRVRGAVQFQLEVRRQLLKTAVELGLTPRSRAALSRDLGSAGKSAVDLAAAQEEFLKQKRANGE